MRTIFAVETTTKLLILRDCESFPGLNLGPVCAHLSAVIPGLGPGTHDFAGAILKSWMAGPSQAMTRRAWRKLDFRKIGKL
jgi:hypothetical protein